MNNEAMNLIARKMAYLAIDMYWCRNGTKYASTYIAFDRCIKDLKELEGLFNEIWKKDPGPEDSEFVKELAERYSGHLPRIEKRTVHGDMGVNEEKERRERKPLPDDDRVPQGRIR